MDDRVSIKGYHKVPLDKAKHIIAKDAFPISTSNRMKTMWLGDGIYFWDRLEDAEWWNKGRYRSEAIISAMLICDSDKYVNLDLPEHMEKLRKYANWVYDALVANNAEPHFPDDKAAHDYYCTSFKNFYKIQLIRYSFPRGTEKTVAGFFAPVGWRIQYCATSMEIVSDIHMEYTSTEGWIGEYGYI